MRTSQNPLVTIAIPFYNPGHFIKDAVRSVFAQTYKNWELILINDGSTDNSLAFVKGIKDHRVKIINDGNNLGLVKRLNQISRMAEGKYIARMDADDMMHPDRITMQVEIMENDPNTDVIDTAAFIINMNNDPVGILNMKEMLPNPFEILRRGGFLHPSILAKKEWYLKYPYSERFPRAEDRELWCRSYKETKFYHISKPLYFYRFVGNIRWKAFLQSYYSERKVLLKYGFQMLDKSEYVYYLYILSLIKSMSLITLKLLNVEQIISKYKYKYLSAELKKEAYYVLGEIYNTNINI